MAKNIDQMIQNPDILFINTGSTKKKVYQDLSKVYSAVEPPFWAALTASFIRKNGFKVDILDANAENIDMDETVNIIDRINPQFINIVVYGQQPAASAQLMESVGKLCEKIKEKNKDLIIILSGLYPSALPEDTLNRVQCDYVCQGEGFLTLLGLLKHEEINKIPGIWWKENNKINYTQRPDNIANLDTELDEVAWDLLPMTKYRAHNWQCLDNINSRDYYASISTSLGCPYKCTFCSIHATFGERKIRYWSPDWVLKQIDILVKQHNVKVIKIIDEMFIFNRKHYLAIAEGLIERDYDLNIWAYARVDTILPEHLKTLRNAGFKWLCIGYESGDETVRYEASKGKFNIDDIIKITKQVKDADINIIGNFLFGLPEDDINSMQKTLDLARELQCEYVNFYTTMAYPGSELYYETQKKGIKLPETLIGYSQHSYECQPLPTNKIPAKEVLRFRDQAFDSYFQDENYLKMIEEKFGSDSRTHIEEMTKTKLKRKLLEE